MNKSSRANPRATRAESGATATGLALYTITARIGPDFRRARLGTGHPGHKDRLMGHVLSDFHKSEAAWVETLLGACAEAAPFLAMGEDARYQAEVMRLAPSAKLDPRAGAGDAD